MRRPPTILFIHRRCCGILGRQPLAAVMVESLPRIWSMTSDEAGNRLRELVKLGLVRDVALTEGEDPRPRVILTAKGTALAGVTADRSGVRWVRTASPAVVLDPTPAMVAVIDYATQDAREQRAVESQRPDTDHLVVNRFCHGYS